MRQLWRIVNSQIQYRLILPYLALMILVMLAGAWIALILVSSSWQERFNNYLGQVARNVTGAMAQHEEANLNYLWQVAFAPANPATGAPDVASAMRDEDGAGLRRALRPYFQSGIIRDDLLLERLIAFDLDGNALVDWSIDPQDPVRRTESIGTNLAGLEVVQRVIRGEEDQIGDKYSALIRFRLNEEGEPDYYFFTVVPVRDGSNNDAPVGGLLVAARLSTLLQSLQNQSQSAITAIYDIDGRAIGTTATNVEQQALNMSDALLTRIVAQNDRVRSAARDAAEEEAAPTEAIGEPIDPCLDIAVQPTLRMSGNPLDGGRLPNCSVLTQQTVSGRDYQFVYAPLIIRGVQSGYYSVALSRDFVISAWSSSRWVIILVTALLAVGVVLVGYRVARDITRPLRDLVATAEAVTHGQLDRRTTVVADDELGTLARAFNRMTDHLLQLYTTSRELNRAIEIRQVLAVASDAASAFVPGSEALVLLEDEGEWRFHVRAAAAATLRDLANMSMADPDPLLGLLNEHDEIRRVDVHSELPDESLLRQGAGMQTLLVAPLVVQDELRGALILGHSDNAAFDEAVQTLTIIINMCVTVMYNAILYTRVQNDAKERQAILSSIGDGVIVCDDQGRIVLLNSMAEEMLKLPDWRTQTYTIDDLAMELAPAAPELFGGSDGGLEHYRIGDHIVSQTRTPVIAEGGRQLGEVLILHDVSREAAVDQAKTDFIATISHELRTPLTVIRGYIDLLWRDARAGRMSPDQADFVDQVRMRSADMTSLINNAITIASLEAGKMTTELQPQDVWVILEMALAPVRPAFESKGLSITIDIPADLSLVAADREQLKIVFAQLIDNAYRYTREGGLTVRAKQRDGVVHIDFIDTGPGIATDALGRLFTRFQRVEGNNAVERGGGLGLVISKQLVTRQGGEIQVQSETGKGSTFTVILPQANEQSLVVAQSETASSSN